MPRYWPTWLGLALLRLTLVLPVSWRYRLGARLGDLLRLLVVSRRHVVDTNLRLCFPELTAEARKARSKAIFRNNAIGIMETAMAWWAPQETFDGRVTFKGEEHLKQAIEGGKGVLLVGGHFSMLDLGGLLVRRYFTVDSVYRPHNNPLMEHFICQGRSRAVEQLISTRDLRTMARRLRQGKVVWYAPDQDHGPGPSVYAPFFGVPAATITATARLAKLSGAPVLTIVFHRLPDNSYELECYPALENFPSGDDVVDASAVNAVLEKGIRKDPDQYMWVHRRFKTHPKGKNYLYTQSADQRNAGHNG